MKRLFSFLMVVLILASLAACNKNDGYNYVSPSTPNTQDTVVEDPPATEILPVDQKPLVTVSLPIRTAVETAEDGTELIRYTYQNMFLILPESDVGKVVTDDFQSRREQTDKNAEALFNSVKDAYEPGAAWTPYVYQAIYEPTRIDNGVLSLFGRNTVFNGSSHPETTYLSVSYDLVTGQVLTLDKVISADTDVTTFVDLLAAALGTIAEEKQLYSGYETMIADRFSGNYLHDTDWYFTDTGLTFFFSPYEIAPYSSGVIAATIPYENLTGILDDAYFPGEKETAAGKLLAKLYTEGSDKEFTQFSDAVVDTDGEYILLYTDHYIQNIRIVSGSWSADGNTFTPESTVFAADGLTQKDAIMLQANLNVGAPSLQINYETSGKSVSAYLSGTPGTSVTLK